MYKYLQRINPCPHERSAERQTHIRQHSRTRIGITHFAKWISARTHGKRCPRRRSACSLSLSLAPSSAYFPRFFFLPHLLHIAVRPPAAASVCVCVCVCVCVLVCMSTAHHCLGWLSWLFSSLSNYRFPRSLVYNTLITPLPRNSHTRER